MPRQALIVDLPSMRALFAAIADQPRETCAFAYLDRDGRLLGMRYTPSGSFSRVEVPIRDVARDALAFDARRVVMAHNHPSGDPTPSTDDLAITRRVARALDALGLRLVEHLILSGDRCTSLRAAGVV